MTRDDVIEAMVKALVEARCSPLMRSNMTDQEWLRWGRDADMTLSAIEALGLVVVPKEATGEMIERGVNYRLKTSIDMHNRWPDDTANIWSAMIAASPLAQKESRQ